MTDLDRRTFLTGSAALAAALAGCRTSKQDGATHIGPTTEEAAGLGAEDANAPQMSDGRPAVRVLLAEADGSPLDGERARLLHARDLHNDPLPQSIATATGRARVELNRDEPIQLVCRLKVPAFGEVYCYADNEGKGYTRAENIDFVAEAAQTRARRVTDSYLRLKPTGLALSADFYRHVEGMQGAREAYQRLGHGLHAGEMLTLAAARHRIAKLAQPRKGFYFGVMVSKFADGKAAYDLAVRGAFNFATASWYTWKNEEPPEQRIDYARMDSSIIYCLDRNIVPKTFGYLYMARGATPEWIRPVETMPGGSPATQPAENTLRRYNERWPYGRLKRLYIDVVQATMARYNGQPVPFAEIMNEAHDKANLWHMSHDQILDIGRAVFAAAREANPTIKRLMNHCCMWAEYAKTRNRDGGQGGRRWSPWQFVDMCLSNRLDYERIGLQLYYPQYDLFEIERMLDRFEVFNRPVHITELATASVDGLDPASMRPNTAAPGWHGPWSESTQADWVEAIYTICYSKPYIECVGWWDLADTPGHFWPHGGLLDAQLQPKEAYRRLRTLQDSWGVSLA